MTRWLNKVTIGLWVALIPLNLLTCLHAPAGLALGGVWSRCMLVVCVAWPIAYLLEWLVEAAQRNVRRRRSSSGLCSACGYSLRGNVSGVCPECGTCAAG
jgi:hypothetical protein